MNSELDSSVFCKDRTTTATISRIDDSIDDSIDDDDDDDDDAGDDDDDGIAETRDG